MEKLRGDSAIRRELIEYVQKRLQMHRAALENPNMNKRDTALLRGRIAELKMLEGEVNNAGEFHE